MTPEMPSPERLHDSWTARLLRRVLVILIRLIYRLEVEGGGFVPASGGALIVSNHLSLIDALLLQAACRRPVRFLMFKDYYEHRWVRPFARRLGMIPISSRQRPRELVQALRTASEALRAGDLVGIFAEGQVTRIGQMLPFRRGFERIIRDAPVPVLPVCLDGVWGSIFSFNEGRFVWKLPRRIPYPVTIKFGTALPPTTTPREVRQAVQNLGALAWRHRKARMLPLSRALIRTARRHPRRWAMADQRTPRLTWGGLLPRVVFLARRLGPVWAGQSMVGILLPPTIPAALVNYAALLLGKVPVNLNYTASREVMASCMRQCGIEQVLTSRVFLDRLKLEIPGRAVLLEDVAAKPGRLERLTALLLSTCLPATVLERRLSGGRSLGLDDPATVIFSSGSTGDPKGVVLTHYNVLSNIEQIGQVFALGRHDRFLGILPFFHSFGFTTTLCLPGVLGVGVAFHPSPLDPEPIADLVRQHAITFLLSTPTFLQLYLRSCEPEDFGSLHFVMAGAEKLPERLASAFEEKFGIRPVEGYGCTECSPAVAVNARDFRSAGIRQVAAKRGRIGHPLPGMSVKIVDPATFAPLGTGEAGLLLVKGPNVMKGYLNRPEKTAEVFREGWYVTGDIAAEDEDGFLQITDRLSRFSKIGGEMVPHVRIEEALHEAAGKLELSFVVSAVPDEKKGERLVVLHRLAPDQMAPLLAKLPALGLPNLWIPRAADCYAVDGFPLLGSGKLDLRGVKELARVKAAGAAAA